MHTEQRVILAADDFSKAGLLKFIRNFGRQVYGVKIHNLYDEFGPGIVAELKQAGARKVWVDAKLHDIPHTVRLRAQAFAAAGCDIITVHASGGVEMMSAAKEGFSGGQIFAVTVLTSLENGAVQNIYNSPDVQSLVVRLALLAKQAGVDGVVCSPREIAAIRTNSALSELKLVIPGIRSAGVNADDQKRFDTPGNAITAGADFLVLGRQLTKALDPAEVLDLLENEIARVLK